MAYKALYRKYRPNTFEEVVGQQHIVMTLQNAIKNNKLGHAYLFCGPRGTGKTTIAKILAKTINCESSEERPCCKCSSCIDIQESNHPDVIEMDAATNNGVDEVREIIDKVKFAPMNGKYKVYIIDEIHMMTSSAFNALLKTLEEPPEYCIFILATTEPHKVLPTIISRCQRFDFKKIAKPVLKGNINRVCDKEGIKVSDEAMDLIADLAEGGMRDALSILDQCIAYAQNDITLEDVSAVYGVATKQDKISLLECIKKQDSKELINKTKKIAANGIDIQRLTTDLIDICKEAVVYSYSKNKDVLALLNMNDVNNLLAMFSSTQLLQYIDYLIDTQGKYRDATNSLTYFEVCMLKMMDYRPQEVTYIQPQPVTRVENTITTKEIKTPKEDVTISAPKIKDYSDEEFYLMLKKATKGYKEMDNKIVYNLPVDKFADREKKLYALIKQSAIMASSDSFIIFTLDERNQVNEINEEGNNRVISELLNRYLQSQKKIIAITRDQSSYLITYFKTRESEKNNAPEKVEEEKKPDPIQGLEQLFGKGNFDVVEE